MKVICIRAGEFESCEDCTCSKPHKKGSHNDGPALCGEGECNNEVCRCIDITTQQGVKALEPVEKQLNSPTGREVIG